MIGTVTGFEIGKNRDASQDVLLLQVQISEPDDVQTVEYMSAAGDDSVPPIGSRVTILQAGSAWKIAIASQDSIVPSMDEGERKIYSSKDGAIKAFINWLSTGILELNGNNDFAVRFNALDAQITVLNSKYDAHFHPDPVSGVTGPPTVALGLDISGAKVDEVKIK